MKTRTIRQSVSFRAGPREVYEALMDSKKHSAFTDSKASISRKAGGKIMAYDGYIAGKNLELEPGKRIVQLWKAGEGEWPEGHYSRVTFSLRKSGSGTRLAFTHSGVPERLYKDLKQGWKDAYWEPMRRFLEKK